jgi:hypothetical protein
MNYFNSTLTPGIKQPTGLTAPSYLSRFLGLGMSIAIAHFAILAIAPVAKGMTQTTPITSVKQAAVEDATQAEFRRRVEEPPLVSRNTEEVLEEIVTLFARDEPPLGSRTAFCAISPGLVGDTDVIWSDRPLFLWQGEANQLTLRTFDTHQTVWQQTDLGGTQRLQYTGPALQPGQIYQWQMIGGDLQENVSFIFQVMSVSDRQLITTELEVLEAQLKATNASAENIAAERSRYFAERGLWSDALAALYRVENPSAAVTNTIQQISTRVCGDRNSSTEATAPYSRSW